MFLGADPNQVFKEFIGVDPSGFGILPGSAEFPRMIVTTTCRRFNITWVLEIGMREASWRRHFGSSCNHRRCFSGPVGVLVRTLGLQVGHVLPHLAIFVGVPASGSSSSLLSFQGGGLLGTASANWKSVGSISKVVQPCDAGRDDSQS